MASTYAPGDEARASVAAGLAAGRPRLEQPNMAVDGAGRLREALP
jgi:hypothetical protein